MRASTSHQKASDQPSCNPIGQPILLRMRAISTHHQKAADQPASRIGGRRKPTNQRSSRRAGSG